MELANGFNGFSSPGCHESVGLGVCFVYFEKRSSTCTIFTVKCNIHEEVKFYFSVLC